MNPTICANAEINTTGQLTDLRDGKQYWVSKLADGNCWMTQNLDFDIPSTVSSNSTNVEGTMQTDTVKVSTPAEWNSTDPKYNAYYDPGEYYYNGPNNTHAQGVRCYSTIGLSECAEKYPGEWSTTGDSHYHVGNYYSYSAITVKSGNNLTVLGDNATQSICPKGWQLPNSGVSNVNSAPWSNNGSFARLLESYGWKWDKTHYASSLNGGTDYYIYGAPFYFVFSGILGISNLNYAGSIGWSNSSTVHDTRSTFFLNFSIEGTLPSNYANLGQRFYGMPVRCVAK